MALIRALPALFFLVISIYTGRRLCRLLLPNPLRKRRRLSTAVFRVAVQMITGLRQADTQCGVKGLQGKAANAIVPLLRTDGFAFDVEIFCCARDRHLTAKPMPVHLANGDDSTIRLVWDSMAMLRDLLMIRARSARGAYRIG